MLREAEAAAGREAEDAQLRAARRLVSQVGLKAGTFVGCLQGYRAPFSIEGFLAGLRTKGLPLQGAARKSMVTRCRPLHSPSR